MILWVVKGFDSGKIVFHGDSWYSNWKIWRSTVEWGFIFRDKPKYERNRLSCSAGHLNYWSLQETPRNSAMWNNKMRQQWNLKLKCLPPFTVQIFSELKMLGVLTFRSYIPLESRLICISQGDSVQRTTRTLGGQTSCRRICAATHIFSRPWTENKSLCVYLA